MSGTLTTAAGLGFATGLRSMTPAAMVARTLAQRPPRRHAGRLADWLGRPGVAAVLTVLAAGELAADKLPGTPDRVDTGPLLARLLLGGALGAVVEGRVRGRNATAGSNTAASAAAGVLGAAAGAMAGWLLRREAVRSTTLPDFAVAVAEDAVAITAARGLAARL